MVHHHSTCSSLLLVGTTKSGKRLIIQSPMDPSVFNHDAPETAPANRNHRNNQELKKKSQEGETKLTLRRLAFLFLFLVFFPLLPMLLSTVCGGFLALVENASFLDGFLYVASNLLNMATPLTDFNPNDPIGITVDVYISVLALMTFGISLNVVNLFQIPLAINSAIKLIVDGTFVVPLIALGLVIPLLFGIVGVLFGVILAPLEGWGFEDGIYYVFSNLLGLGTPLTDVSPTTIPGDIIDIVVSSMALGCIAVVVDYVTVLNPARYVRKRFKEFLTRRGMPELENVHDPPLGQLPSSIMGEAEAVSTAVTVKSFPASTNATLKLTQNELEEGSQPNEHEEVTWS